MLASRTLEITHMNGHNSYQKFGLAGQNKGQLTKKQRAKSMADKERYKKQLNRSFQMAILNPPIVIKPFSHMRCPGTVKVIHECGTRIGHFKK